MELRVLQYFLAVAREQNISAAAHSLHLTQPTLSRQLRELEEELGKQLMIRGNRKITLTQDGMLLRKRAEDLLSMADKISAPARPMGSGRSPELPTRFSSVIRTFCFTSSAVMPWMCVNAWIRDCWTLEFSWEISIKRSIAIWSCP